MHACARLAWRNVCMCVCVCVCVCVDDSQVVSSHVAATRAAVTACLFLSALSSRLTATLWSLRANVAARQVGVSVMAVVAMTTVTTPTILHDRGIDCIVAL